MFHIVEREMQWRRERGQPEGFGALRAFRPVVAVGAEDPLENQKMLADYFRMCTLCSPSFFCRRITSLLWKHADLLLLMTDGIDGLGGIHESVCLTCKSYCSRLGYLPGHAASAFNPQGDLGASI